MGEGALNLAIELHRHPMLRHGVRNRPLPADIGELLLLAGGSPVRLAEAANALGEPADEVLQAVRFFIQEALLFPDADPYRVLGVAPDADEATLKAHHRALQHWLHPDRLAESPESAYASRINWAWNQLRTPNRRRDFDASHVALINVDASRVAAVHVQRWERVNASGSQWGPQIGATAALFLLCVGLLWLALRDRGQTAFPDVSDWVGSVDRPDPVVSQDSMPAGPIEPAAIVKLVAAQPRLAAVHIPPPPITPSLTAPASPIAPAPASAAVSSAAVIQSEGRSVLAKTITATAISDADFFPQALERSRPMPVEHSPRVDVVAIVHTASLSAVSLVEPAAPSADEWMSRTTAAHAQAATLLSFITRRDGTPPPIWHRAEALDTAEAIRQDVISGQFFHRTRFELDQAHWTIDEEVALLTVPVGAGNRDSGVRTLEARLVWKNNAWWVDSLAVETQP